MSRRHVQTLIKQGALAARRFGRDWFLDPADVKAYRRTPRGWPKGKSRKKTKIAS